MNSCKQHTLQHQPLHAFQQGASLIEVLVSILILSIGILALASTLMASIQLPKQSLYRSLATNIAHNYIDKIRANPSVFKTGGYDETLSYDGTFNTGTKNDCAYPICTDTDIANMDKAYTNWLLRQQLPAGGMRLDRTDASGAGTSATEGNLWIMWQEPDSNATFQNIFKSDDCPDTVISNYGDKPPRCLYIRFRVPT